MPYQKKELLEYNHNTLISIIEELQLRMVQRNSKLKDVRSKLRTMRSKVMKMKGMLQTQAKRILELYHTSPTTI